MKQIIIIGTDTLLQAGRSLFRQGMITHTQLEEMQRRSDLLSDDVRLDTVMLE